jgi:hypothetical protein
MRMRGPRASVGLGGFNMSGPRLSFGGGHRGGHGGGGLIALTVQFLVFCLLLNVWTVQYFLVVPTVAAVRGLRGARPVLPSGYLRPWIP